MDKKKWWVQYDLGTGVSVSMTEFRETPPMIGESSMVAGRCGTVIGFADMSDASIPKRERVKKDNEKPCRRNKRVR